MRSQEEGEGQEEKAKGKQVITCPLVPQILLCDITCGGSALSV